MFWSLFVFHEHSLWEPASVAQWLCGPTWEPASVAQWLCGPTWEPASATHSARKTRREDLEQTKLNGPERQKFHKADTLATGEARLYSDLLEDYNNNNKTVDSSRFSLRKSLYESLPQPRYNP